MQSAYAAYRDRFHSERGRAIDARRNAAWERERAQRQREAQRRREARQLLRTVARLGARGLIIRQLAYWSIDVVMARRRAQEYDAARVRWEATKIVLASERRLVHGEKIMDYRSFVTEKARAGDQGAQRVLAMLTAPARSSQSTTAKGEPRVVSLDEVRARLATIRAEEEARFDRARAERERLPRVAQPATLDDVLAMERKRIEKKTTEEVQFTEVERRKLTEFAELKRSWNPLTRASATKAEATLHEVLRARRVAALGGALREFEAHDVPQIGKRIAGDERRYREYITASLELEGEMREARRALRDGIPRVEQQVSILERAGLTQFEGCASRSNAPLDQLAVAIDQQYHALPDATRHQAERSVRRDGHARDRSRESIPMGDR
jgi:hypothetical protein